ncbi:hypothetical protein AKJ16_DCAP03670 [Drosera capensis]
MVGEASLASRISCLCRYWLPVICHDDTLWVVFGWERLNTFR